jgi:hypothetical protein
MSIYSGPKISKNVPAPMRGTYPSQICPRLLDDWSGYRRKFRALGLFLLLLFLHTSMLLSPTSPPPPSFFSSFHSSYSLDGYIRLAWHHHLQRHAVPQSVVAVVPLDPSAAAWVTCPPPPPPLSVSLILRLLYISGPPKFRARRGGGPL